MTESTFCGKGAFGTVERIPVNYDGRQYVIKKISLNRLKVTDNSATLSKVLQEVRILAQLEHPHIVRYYLHGFIDGPNKDKYEKDESTPINNADLDSGGGFQCGEEFFFIRMD